MIRRPPRSTQSRSSAASDVYKRQFITHPSFGQTMKGPGFYEISGIAFSGTGRIAKVMVSADGGKSWGEAALQGPVHSKAFTRFRMPWRWDGGPALQHG